MSQSNFLLDRLNAILPEIAKNADKAEAERKAPEESIRLLNEIQLNRAFLPKVCSSAFQSMCRNRLGIQLTLYTQSSARNVSKKITR